MICSEGEGQDPAFSFRECDAARVVDVLDGVAAKLISLAHLRVNKRAAGRHRDLDDPEHLL